ncbi:hypothetical protein [Rhodococcus sp. MALMAid1271]|uniref:hypothetical protein n=1 Tax=Rhodococcus sp. MALMAid1271 TaxID=3411744 RepID=UPI003B9F5C65
MTAPVRQPSLSNVNVPAFMLAAASALGLVISALGSWVSTPFGGLAGTSTADGKIVLGVGVVAGLAVFVRSVVASLLAVVVMLICGIAGLVTAFTDVVAFEGEDASVGWGLWLVPVTSAALLIASIVLLFTHPFEIGARTAGPGDGQALPVTAAQERRYILLALVLMVVTVGLLAVAVVVGVTG